jgi:hypothetical protein
LIPQGCCRASDELRRNTGYQDGQSVRSAGGRTWWAHLDFIRMNVEPIILENQIEELMEMLASGGGCFPD